MRKMIMMTDVLEIICKKLHYSDKEKVRDKIINIIENLGLDKTVFYSDTYEKYTGKKPDVNVNNTRRTNPQYMFFPESSLDFLTDIVKKYSEADMLEVRKGKYWNSVDEVVDLVNGFSEMLKNMDLPDEKYNEQIRMIHKITRIDYETGIKKLKEILDGILSEYTIPEIEKDDENVSSSPSIQELMDSIHSNETLPFKDQSKGFKYNDFGDRLDDEDVGVFLTMATNEYELIRKRHRDIYKKMIDIKVRDLDMLIEEESAKMSMDEIEEDDKRSAMILCLYDELENDPEYQELEKERKKLIRRGADKAKITKIDNKKNKIIDKYQNEVFGKEESIRSERPRVHGVRSGEELLYAALREYREDNALHSE